MLGPIEKRIILSMVILVWLCFMIFMLVNQLSSYLPEAPQLSFYAPAAASVERAKKVTQTFTGPANTKHQPARNLNNPFFPTPGQPPPPPPPPPPPQSTKPVDFIYQGFYVTTSGDKIAYVMVGDKLLISGIGTNLVADLVVSRIALQTLRLKDSQGGELDLEFDLKKTLELPAQ